jgi:hypothetical protein
LLGRGNIRNRRCACGSGKKEKHCCNGRLPVSQTITVDFGKKTKINDARIRPDGSLVFVTDGEEITPQRAWFGSHSIRKSGKERPRTRIPINPENLNFNGLMNLRRFDRIFAIDTNTNLLPNGETLSVSCLVECRLREEKKYTDFEFIPIGVFSFINGPAPKYENFAWYIAISAIEQNTENFKDKNFALITDSDLGQHGDINAREVPYFSKHVLPNQFTILYATDKGQEVLNQPIKLCDKEAGKFSDNLMLGRVKSQKWLRIQGGWCEAFAAQMNIRLDRDWLKIKRVSHSIFLKAEN